MADGNGGLSAWILTLHGLKAQENTAGDAKPRVDEGVVRASTEFVTRRLGPEIDVRQAQRSIAQTKKITDAQVPKIVEAHRNGNLERFGTLTSHTTAEIMGAAGIPANLFPGGLSSEQFSQLWRAMRASLFCLALHNQHPLVLIKRAVKGDREAVLKLVKADKLFLQDSCCAATIRKAELQGDRGFEKQLAKALECQPTVRRREILQFYFQILFLLEGRAVQLPTLNELWITLDPFGREYESLSAFERDFQRRRQDFARMFREADEEVLVRSGSSVSK